MKSRRMVAEQCRSVIVPDESGFHKRVVWEILRLAQSFQSDILFSAGPIRIDAKSTLMALMALGALSGQSLLLTARGHDAKQALDTLANLF
jgi:phosphotransferase system HPr (HPr) family protein